MQQVTDRSKVSVKKESGMKNGRGFSLNELKEAKVSLHEAKVLRIPVDSRRKSCHKENIENINKLKK